LAAEAGFGVAGLVRRDLACPGVVRSDSAGLLRTGGLRLGLARLGLVRRLRCDTDGPGWVCRAWLRQDTARLLWPVLVGLGKARLGKARRAAVGFGRLLCGLAVTV
jgi:hypothetical protein